MKTKRFQLTHSRGVRHPPAPPIRIKRNFNSRTHVECDQWKCAVWHAMATFQLTHSRGVRLGLYYHSPSFLSFQLTHSRGVRRATITVTIDDASDFNSRTHVECDNDSVMMLGEITDFNSRTHVECDARSGGINYEYQNFNSRTHVECD